MPRSRRRRTGERRARRVPPPAGGCAARGGRRSLRQGSSAACSRHRPQARKAEAPGPRRHRGGSRDRKSTRLNSSHLVISYAVFCLKKKKKKNADIHIIKKIEKITIH